MVKVTNAGQIEMLLIIPLLLTVLIINYIVINYVESSNYELDQLADEYNCILQNYTYFKNPTTGNSYPIMVNQN
jgi:hypothetical protein